MSFTTFARFAAIIDRIVLPLGIPTKVDAAMRAFSDASTLDRKREFQRTF